MGLTDGHTELRDWDEQSTVWESSTVACLEREFAQGEGSSLVVSAHTVGSQALDKQLFVLAGER